VLDFYAARSPIFMAAVFDGTAAAERGQAIGDGTPVHLTIPTTNPWVPLRILGLGKQEFDRVEADVYLLTDDKPALLPFDDPGLSLAHSKRANQLLLDDLRSDEGMGWVPTSAWLTKLEIDSFAGDLKYDLAVDASGQGQPSARAAGLELPVPPQPEDDAGFSLLGVAVLIALGVGLVYLISRMRPQGMAS
jgi:hypothetical protein